MSNTDNDLRCVVCDNKRPRGAAPPPGSLRQAKRIKRRKLVKGQTNEAVSKARIGQLPREVIINLFCVSEIDFFFLISYSRNNNPIKRDESRHCSLCNIID